MRSIAAHLLHLGLVASLLTNAHASDVPSPFSLSGFGTVGAVRTDKDSRIFRSSTEQGSGARTSFDLSVDSVLGLQASLSLGSALDLTVQSVVRKGVADSYDPLLTWGFLRFQATPEVFIRAGRMRTPFFMYSDSLNLNYANPWVRPPVEVYSLNPFADLNGVDALYRTPIGATDLELHIFGGKSPLDVEHGAAKLQTIRGIKAALSVSGLTLQAGYARSNLSIHWGDSLFSMLNTQLLATGNAHIAQDLSGNDSKASFLSAGFQYDSDRVLLIGEYARRSVDRYTVSSAGWYLTSGYRFGPLTPYVTVARQSQTAPVTTAQSNIAAVDGLIDLFNAMRNKAQSSTSIGVRWDAARNIAIKTQLERVQPGPGGLGIFLSDNVRDNMDPGGPVHVFSISADFVF